MDNELETGPVLVNRTELLAKAEENKAKRALPKAPGTIVSFSAMNDWLKCLTPDMVDGGRVIIYVYRLEPAIVRQKIDADADNNIDVLMEVAGGIEEEYFIKNHGAGKYRLLVKDLDNPRTQKGGFFSADLVISSTLHSYTLDLREVDWDNKNNKGFKAYCRANKLIDENNMPVMEKKAAAADTPPPGTDTTKVLELFMAYVSKMGEQDQARLKSQLGENSGLGKGIGEILLERMKQDDPTKQVGMITGLIAAMNSNKSNVPDPMVIMMPLILQMMKDSKESSDRQMQMMMELMKKPEKEETGEQKSEIEKMRELIGLAKELKGNGATAPKTTAEVVAGVLETSLGPLLTIVGNIVALKAAQTGTPTAPMPTPVIPVQNANERVNERNNENMKPVPGIPASESASDTEVVQVINVFKGTILNKLKDDGWEFGAWVAEGYGDPMAAKIANCGVDRLLVGSKTVGDFWQQVSSTYGEEYYIKWLASFVNYKEIMKQMDSEEDEEEEEKVEEKVKVN